MAEGRRRVPRIRMPSISKSSRRGGPAAATEETPTKESADKDAPTKEASTKEAPSKETDKPEGPTKETAKPAPKGKAPEPNLQERMEGVQGWMAELERKQARLTYFGAAGILIAVLASGAALYFGLTAKNDSATKSDVDDLTKQVQTLQGAVTKNTKDTQNALNATVTGLQATIAELQKKQAQQASNISTLQSQINSATLNKGAAGATTGTTATPGTTTTTPKKP